MNIEKAKKILLSLASLTLDEIRGSSVHPSENFNPLEIYELVFGEEKVNQIIRIGVDELERRVNEKVEKWKLNDFYIDTETLEITSDRGGISFYSIKDLINEFGYNLKDKETIIRFEDIQKQIKNIKN